jgi:hypothetical protein
MTWKRLFKLNKAMERFTILEIDITSITNRKMIPLQLANKLS